MMICAFLISAFVTSTVWRTPMGTEAIFVPGVVWTPNVSMYSWAFDRMDAYWTDQNGPVGSSSMKMFSATVRLENRLSSW